MPGTVMALLWLLVIEEGDGVTVAIAKLRQEKALAEQKAADTLEPAAKKIEDLFKRATDFDQREAKVAAREAELIEKAKLLDGLLALKTDVERLYEQRKGIMGGLEGRLSELSGLIAILQREAQKLQGRTKSADQPTTASRNGTPLDEKAAQEAAAPTVE